jgi:hypothetical protein
MADLFNGILYLIAWTCLHIQILYKTKNRLYCIPWIDMKDEDLEGQRSISIDPSDLAKFTTDTWSTKAKFD